MKRIYIIYLLGLLVGGAIGLFIPLSSLLLSEKHIPESIIGLISATYFIAMIIGSYIFIKMSKRFEAYKLVVVALLMAMISIFVFVKINSLIIYLICMFIVGLGISFNFIMIQNALVQYNIDNSTITTSIYAFSFAMGFACSTACGTNLFAISKYLAFGTACMLLLVDLIIICFVRIQLNSTEHRTENYTFWKFSPFLLGGFIYGFVENAFTSFYAIYLLKYYSIRLSGIILGSFVLGGILGMIPLSKLSDKLGIHKACVLFSIGTLIGFGFIVETEFKLIFSVIAGAFLCVIYPSTLAALNIRNTSKDEILWATGLYSMVYALGSALGPLFSGIAMNYSSIGLFVVCACLVILFMFVHLLKLKN